MPKSEKSKTILIPYEFLSDTIKVGEYIKNFIKADFKILFKIRIDDLLESQLEAYFLDEYKDKLEIINDITPEKMAEVDIIAGTQTTLLFDLLPYNKPIWILETSFRLMYDMIEDGFARLITESDMQRIDEIFEKEIKKEKTVDKVFFYGGVPMIDAISNYMNVCVSKK